MKKNPAVLGLIAAMLIASAHASDTEVDARPRPSHSAYMEVDYSDTLLGVQALFAVRVCVTKDVPLGRRAATNGGPAVNPMLHELPMATPDDVVLRVFDGEGSEISQHVGARDVCGYARMAGAFLATQQSPHLGGQQ